MVVKVVYARNEAFGQYVVPEGCARRFERPSHIEIMVYTLTIIYPKY